MIIDGNDPYREASFTLGHRIRRQLWNTTWLLLFRPSPRPLHRWRGGLLKLFGAKLGRYVHIQASVRVWAPWNLEVGHFVGVGDGVTIYSMAKICIGDYAVVSQGTHLCAGTHDFNTPNFQLSASPISVGSRVWLCAETFVGPGVSIAEGSVIAARGVVPKSIVRPWMVWAGVPVKPIGERDKNRVLSQ